jgi:hypothetical protein
MSRYGTKTSNIYKVGSNWESTRLNLGPKIATVTFELKKDQIDKTSK